jgi:ATP-dependent helicase/nuclease subunit B
VVITRAQKRNSSPTVPSRLLQRLEAFVGQEVGTAMRRKGDRYRSLAQSLDRAALSEPLGRPAPKPDPALVPRSLSVTEIETLVRDPYSIFAKHVLKLDPLDPLALMPSASNRGIIIHEVLGRFAEASPEAMPPHAAEILMQLGQDGFAEIAATYPELYAEWWPRFERLATEFLVWEEQRRGSIRRVHPEVDGVWSMELPDGSPFQLRARADRIEHRTDGTFAIIDYKTGMPPSAREVFAGFAPQLTLEAAMLLHGAFRGLPRAKTAPDLIYVHTSGGRKPFNERPIDPPRDEERSVQDLVAEHQVRLKGMLARFLTGEAGFASRPYPKYAKAYARYDHLARVKEWSLGSQESDS